MLGEDRRCLAEGMDEFLSPPVQPDSLGRCYGELPDRPTRLCSGQSEMPGFFARELHPGVADIVRTHDSGNAKSLARVVRPLVGNFGIVGSERFVEMARMLENSDSEGDMHAAGLDANAISAAMEQLLPSVETAIAGMRQRTTTRMT